MADSNPYRFSTKYLDQETSLYYYGHRFYSPELGRWCSRDPIEERSANIELYRFAGNSPIVFVDILGLSIRTSPNGAWEVRRDTGNPTGWATCKKCSNAKELADYLRLQSNEYSKWMQPQGTPMPATEMSTIEPGSVFGIPNRILMTYGWLGQTHAGPTYDAVRYAVSGNPTGNLVAKLRQDMGDLRFKDPNPGEDGMPHPTTRTQLSRDIDMAVWIHAAHGMDVITVNGRQVNVAGMPTTKDGSQITYRPIGDFIPHHHVAQAWLFVCFSGLRADAWLPQVVARPRGSLFAPDSADLPRNWNGWQPRTYPQ